MLVNSFNIIVCIKQVPDTNELRIDPETNTLIREGVPSVMNPFDENALEEALRIREKLGEGCTVTVLSMGPPQAADTLRSALAMGADRAILVSDRKFSGADTYATSYTLAAAIRKTGIPDITLFGKQAVDGDTAQVGPGVAEHLDLPLAAYVRKLTLSPDRASVEAERVMEHAVMKLELRLPAVFTVLKEINVPRLPRLRDKLRSRKEPVAVWTAVDLRLDGSRTGLDGSPTWVRKVYAPERTKKVRMLEGSTGKVSAELISLLREKGLVSGP